MLLKIVVIVGMFIAVYGFCQTDQAHDPSSAYLGAIELSVGAIVVLVAAFGRMGGWL